MKYTQYPIQKENGVIFFDRSLHKAEFIPIEQLIQCKICGKYLKAISTHLVRKHGTNEKDYKEEFCIPFTEGLVSHETRVKLVEATNNWHKRMNPKEKERILKAVRAAPRGYNGGHRNSGSYSSPASHAWRESLKKKHLGNKAKVLALIRAKYNQKPQRLRKTDFDKKEYGRIFWLFGSLSVALREAGLPEYPDIREWQRKPQEEIDQRKRSYQRKWIQNNREKNRAYGRQAYWKNVEVNRVKGRKRYHEKRKFEIQKKSCPTCEKLILAESPRCRSCTMRLRNKERNNQQKAYVQI